ncbi:hypothetical protein SAMN05444172_3703 [Burkholderia sp. GAS332]|nr:hypothetical protein SAMN05444172_3703 [Burkholderia sp. GAS332]
MKPARYSRRVMGVYRQQVFFVTAMWATKTTSNTFSSQYAGSRCRARSADSFMPTQLVRITNVMHKDYTKLDKIY